MELLTTTRLDASKGVDDVGIQQIVVGAEKPKGSTSSIHFFHNQANQLLY
jgi:hypothetical protein